jgi:23S rRNA pseudouridine1911/1915/1917 synthase
VPAEPQAEAIPLSVLYEDADLIVIDKPAGMAAHPAPGQRERHPGQRPAAPLRRQPVGHRRGRPAGHRPPLDKETSGVMVAAKTDAAHQGLSALFAAHDIERVYVALTRGAPRPAAGPSTTRSAARPTTARRWRC